MTLWLTSLVLPVACATLIAAGPPLGRVGLAAAPLAAVPALVAALVPGPPVVDLPWLLLGSRLRLDGAGRLFLFFTAVVWAVAAVYARAYVKRSVERFFVFYLLAMAGNIGLILAADLASFYSFFALMTFAAYGLVVHDGTADAWRAGRVYLVMAVAGESMLLTGFLLAAGSAATLDVRDVAAGIAASPARDLIVALLMSGFAIKAGAVPLHVWLPLAHPVAPTPASAVLSGCMIKAGLLGWLRFLPLGLAALPVWGGIVLAAGLLAAFFGVVLGLTQRDPKTTLAYSSISQMGLINVAVGVSLMETAAWPMALMAVPVYAFHHGMAKASLFLAVGVTAGRRTVSRALLTAGMVLAALALAGGPLTSGAAAKLVLKQAAAAAPAPWQDWLDTLLPLAAVGTTLLMWHFLTTVLAARHDARAGPTAGTAIPWAMLVAAVAAATWVVPGYHGLDLTDLPLFRADNLWLSTWPVVAGTLIFLAGRRWIAPTRFSVAAGDLVVPIEWALGRCKGMALSGIRSPGSPVASLASAWYGLFAASRPRDPLARLENRLGRWAAAGLLFIALVAVLFALLHAGQG
jgi:formate hydrogenlyase subunit 3/multisubunit Na+/H+ antiporter MnhD subunit